MASHGSGSKGHERTIVDRYLRAIEEPQVGGTTVPPALVEDFVRVARRFSDRFNISYDAWLDVGVPRHVLARAGISAVHAAAQR